MLTKPTEGENTNMVLTGHNEIAILTAACDDQLN